MPRELLKLKVLIACVLPSFMNGSSDDGDSVALRQQDVGLRALVLFGLLNTLPFPLSVLFDIFGNTLGAISQVVPLGFELPPVFGFIDGILRSEVVDMVATPMAHLLGVPDKIAFFGPESPVMLVWFGMTLLVSALLALGWHRLAPRPNYENLRRWSHLWFRWFLASMMLRYGAMKVFDSQFSEPVAQQLLTPAGELSRMQLLWMVFGASRGFELLIGTVEMFSALLILHRITTLAGLLVLLGALSQIVILNWMCGINVKFGSGFLFAVNLALLVPYWPRIMACLSGGPTPLDEGLSVLASAKNPRRLRRLGWALGLSYLFAFHLTAIRQGRFTQERFPKPWMHGAWEVLELQKNGEPATPEDRERFEHLSFDSFHRFIVSRTQGESLSFVFTYDGGSGAFTLRAMGAGSQDANKDAWQGWTLRKDVSQSAPMENPQRLELRGSIGEDRYLIRAKRLHFRLLGERQ